MRLLRFPRKLSGLVSFLGLSLSLLGALACKPSSKPLPMASPIRAERVISLVPALTEMTYALGEEDRLVGVSSYCKFPPEAQEKPEVGALIQADYEHILSLRPDCMLLRPEMGEVAERLAQYDIGSISLELQSIDDIKQAMRRLGELYDRADRADELVARIDAELREASRTALIPSSRPGEESGKPRVLFVVGRNPGTLQQIYAAGTDSFVEVLIEAAGGRNVLEHTSIPWPVVGKEAILALDPDVIIDGSYMSEISAEDDEQMITPWQQLSVLRAVREGRVIALHDDHMLIPGPSVGEAAGRLASAIRRAFPERSWIADRFERSPVHPQVDTDFNSEASP